MSRTSPVPKDIAADFRLHELFFSRTDRKGIIRSGNAVFIRVSGYDEAELIHRPHNVIRHPDMPRAIFELFWEALKNQRPICAYVKNLTKDGCYYWVFAAAFPVEDGYLSIRLKPSSPLLTQIEALYATLVAIEKERNVAAARAELTRALAHMGFEDYGHFMTRALLTELQSRRNKLFDGGREEVLGAAQGAEREAKDDKHKTKNGEGAFRDECDRALATLRRESQALDRHSCELFASLLHIVNRSELMTENSAKILSLFSRFKPLALNMIVAAEKIGDSSRALTTVAESFQTFAQGIRQEVENLEAAMKPLTAAIRDAELKCGASQLQAEMINRFTNELTSQEKRADFIANCHDLFQLIQRYLGEVDASLKMLGDIAAKFEERSAALHAVIAGLEVIRIRGTIEASQLKRGQEFVAHIRSMQEFVAMVRDALVVLTEKARGSRLSALDGQDIVATMFKRLGDLEKGLLDLGDGRSAAAH